MVIGLRGITEKCRIPIWVKCCLKLENCLPTQTYCYKRNVGNVYLSHGIDEAGPFCVVGTSGVVTVRLSRLDVMTGNRHFEVWRAPSTFRSVLSEIDRCLVDFIGNLLQTKQCRYQNFALITLTEFYEINGNYAIVLIDTCTIISTTLWSTSDFKSQSSYMDLRQPPPPTLPALLGSFIAPARLLANRHAAS